jgi:hypothetical protein
VPGQRKEGKREGERERERHRVREDKISTTYKAKDLNDAATKRRGADASTHHWLPYTGRYLPSTVETKGLPLLRERERERERESKRGGGRQRGRERE